MNKFIETLKNIWSIVELRNKILYTIIVLAVYRLGTHIVLPGVDAAKLAAGLASKNAGDLLGLINNFTGGAFNQGSIFSLGVMPYITASIILQLLGFAVPYFQKLQQHEGESGRKKINQYTRLLTVLISVVQGGAYLTLLNSQDAISDSVNRSVFFLGNSVIMATGTLFAMWLGERITDKGIGNGVSLIIMVGIIATLPRSFVGEFAAQLNSNGFLMILLELVVLFFVTLAAILVVQGVRKIPIQFAKKMVGRSSEDLPSAGNRDYIPLKVNASGVMPIIFAQAIMFLPLTLFNMASESGNVNSFVQSLNDTKSLPYNLIFFVLVILFTYVYTALIVNPKQYSTYLKNNNSFIPGVKPGEDTENYIDSLTTRITFPGSVFLGLIAIMPAIVSMFGVSSAFSVFFGGTSLLILVGVVLDTLAQIESYLLMRKYDSLVSSGKIKGRNAGGIQIGAGY